MTTAQDIISDSSDLVSYWSLRNLAFKDWYNLITMEDTLKEAKMESFASNEPRTFYNLSLHLLTPSSLHPRIPLELLEPEDIEDASEVESFLTKVWLSFEFLSMRRGRGGFLRELVSFLISTGWYSVFSIATDTDIIAEIWNPADTYPEFSEDGLLRCAHVYTTSGRAINRKALLKGWKLSSKFTPNSTVKVYDYWTLENGFVENAIVVGNALVKPISPEPLLETIPIYCSPVAGLPDRGSIIATPEWKRNTGQSILSTNAQMYTYTNKLFTFMMQLIRDTAQARWVEKSAGPGKVRPEDLFKRGALFHIGLNEDLGPLPVPPIPIELRAILMDLTTMRQKGSLPDVMFGSLQQQISGFLMQQISGAATQILRPYHQALKYLLEELCNSWIDSMRQFDLHPLDFTPPKSKLPKVEIDLRLEIPGDIVQRATVARMLDPDFSLSNQTVTDFLFPEIINPLAEQARANRDKAMQHPVMTNLYLMEALRKQAELLREAGDTETASIYDKAAQTLIIGTVGKEQEAVPTPRPEVQPREAREFPLE